MLLVTDAVYGATEVADISDSGVGTGAWGKGRSPSFFLAVILDKRACLEAVSPIAIRTTWTSILFQPADVGPRLSAGDPLSGSKISRIAVSPRVKLAGEPRPGRSVKPWGL